MCCDGGGGAIDAYLDIFCDLNSAHRGDGCGLELTRVRECTQKFRIREIGLLRCESLQEEKRRWFRVDLIDLAVVPSELISRGRIVPRLRGSGARGAATGRHVHYVLLSLGLNDSLLQREDIFAGCPIRIWISERIAPNQVQKISEVTHPESAPPPTTRLVNSGLRRRSMEMEAAFVSQQLILIPYRISPVKEMST